MFGVLVSIIVCVLNLDLLLSFYLEVYTVYFDGRILGLDFNLDVHGRSKNEWITFHKYLHPAPSDRVCYRFDFVKKTHKTASDVVRTQTYARILGNYKPVSTG